MNEKQAVTLLEKMIRIPSPSTGEKKLAMFLKKEFSKKGFKTKIDKAGNFIATKGSGKPLLLLEAHMDTVLPVLPVKKSKGVLHGRGTVDTKSTLAAMLIAADNAKISKGTLTVAGVVEEESTSNKGALFLKSQIKPDYCIVGEPSSWNAISIGYKGTVSFAFEFTAKKTHSSMGMLAGNNFLNFFNELQTHYINEGIETGPSFNQLLIELRNADVDDEKTMAFVSLRLPLSIKAGDCISFINELVKKHQGRMEVLQSLNPSKQSKNNPLVRALLRGIRSRKGKPFFKVKTGTCNMNLYSDYWKCPIVVYGPGDSSLDHSDKERIKLSEYLKSVKILQSVIEELL